mgnify:CR=1 FL=1
MIKDIADSNYVENKINGKKYFCISNDIKSRFAGRGSGYRTPKFREAIEEYGWNNFEHEKIIDGIECKADAIILENEYIVKNLTHINGYNSSTGFENCDYKAISKKFEQFILDNVGELLKKIAKEGYYLCINGKEYTKDIRVLDKYKSVRYLNFFYYFSWRKVTTCEATFELVKMNGEQLTLF